MWKTHKSFPACTTQRRCCLHRPVPSWARPWSLLQTSAPALHRLIISEYGFPGPVPWKDELVGPTWDLGIYIFKKYPGGSFEQSGMGPTSPRRSGPTLQSVLLISKEEVPKGHSG